MCKFSKWSVQFCVADIEVYRDPFAVSSRLQCAKRGFVCFYQGVEGFKHVKKGTNVAAQATGLSIGNVSASVLPLSCWMVYKQYPFHLLENEPT